MHFPTCSLSLSPSWPSLPSQKPGSHCLPIISYSVSLQVLLLSPLSLSSLPAALRYFLSSCLSSALGVTLSPFPCPCLAPPVYLLQHPHSSLSKTTHLIILSPCIKPLSGASLLWKSKLQAWHKASELWEAAGVV